ncbi:MAG: hypothetical protein LUG16_00170 [Candidatus Gastranaerophilales bacterium]|nr:hypothetical protein [Candidatus Gastranaerophilales bacterium]
MLFSFSEFLRLSRQSLFNIFFAKKEDILIKLEQCGFIKLYPVTYDDFIKNVSFKIADLKDMLNNANISYPKNSKKNELFEIAKNNALFETKMQSYTLLTATELFTTSKNIISFLYHGRTENSSRKKFLNIIFLREDYNFVMENG